jgi:hypothetical protein
MYLFLFLIGIVLFLTYSSLDALLLLYKINYNKEKSHYLALKKTIRTICWIGYLMIYQKIYHNYIPIEKNIYDVHYIYHGQLYKIKCINPMGPKKVQVLMITNDDLEDVSNEIIPYLGPKQNFHNMTFRPKDFKQKELCFYLSDGNIVTFKDDSEIKLE